MDLALVVLLLWALLFVPLGIVLHWLVLGSGSRVRALPLAPVTGVAVGVLVVATLGRLGVDAGEPWIPWAFLAVSVACVVVIWRRDVEWRSRELIGAGALLLFAVLLISMPVIGDSGEGPLGYGTVANPVTEVAAIDAAAGGPASELGVAREAAASADERAIGFEQFAALTVAIGQSDETGGDQAPTWSAYGLHSTITGMLAALVTLPLFAFARARGVRWLGLLVLVPLGVVAPAVFLALANGEGAAISSVVFTTAAVFSLLVTRRDRGWWALVVLFGSAVAVTAGPTALMPLVAVGFAWMLLRSDTYEHLSQHDTPVAPMRSLLVVAFAAGMAGIATIPLVANAGEQLSWTALHDDLLPAIMSWPFAWLDTDLGVAGPSGPVEVAIWLIGPALLAVAVIYAIVRNERRELGVLVGAILAGLVAIGVGLLDEQSGIRLFEFTMLSLSPFLAALAIRAVALARENADSPDAPRLAGTGPTLLVLAFVLLSFAATTVTGTRMVHAPTLAIAAGPDAGADAGEDGAPDAVIAAGDPWLAFVVDGEVVRGGYADADAISEEDNPWSSRGTRASGYDQVLLSSSPLSSDPSLRYLEQADLDEYQVRLFRDRLADPAPNRQLFVDEQPLVQRGARAEDTQAGDGESSEAAADELVEEGDDGSVDFTLAQVHTPLEGEAVNTPPDEPAGLLLPAGDVTGCDSARRVELDETAGCQPADPVRGEDCSDADVAAARAHDDVDRPRRRLRPSAQAQVLTVPPDPALADRPTMVGVQCFAVTLNDDSTILLTHLRDVGLILPPQQARTDGSWDTERIDDVDEDADSVLGGVRRESSDLDAQLTFGNGRLSSGVEYDLVLEGEFGAGVELGTANLAIEDSTGERDLIPGGQFGTLRASANGFSSILRRQLVTGAVTVTNDSGTDISIGRLFARPRDLPRSCDMPIALTEGAQREVRTSSQNVGGSETIERPGLVLTVLGIEEDEDGIRVARLAVASYLTRFGLPRYTLVDWTEQYESPLVVDGCDGRPYEEAGARVDRSQVVFDERTLEEQFGDLVERRGEG